MITLRGKVVTPKPLTLTEIGQVIDSLRAYCVADNLLEPATLRHFLRIVATSVRSNFPGASIEELADELLDAIAVPEIQSIAEAIFEPSHYAALKTYARSTDVGHV